MQLISSEFSFIGRGEGEGELCLARDENVPGRCSGSLSGNQVIEYSGDGLGL